ncbi:MAG TPA: hypothetical protein VIN67_08825 [Desulfobaccales bacterium]
MVLKPLVRFIEHLPINGDIELSILKCHLLIEELLSKIINNEAKHSKYLDKANLRFIQKIYLARAFNQGKDDIWPWDAIKKLNDTRNKLAHGLSLEEINIRCNSFIEHVEKVQGRPEDDSLGPTFNRFHWAAFKVFSQLAAYANFPLYKLRMPTLLTGK